MTFRATPDAFIQVNWAQMDVLYQCAIDALGGHAGLRVVDAYAGIGVLACTSRRTRARWCASRATACGAARVLNARVNDVAERMHFVLSPWRTRCAVGAAEMADAVILDHHGQDVRARHRVGWRSLDPSESCTCRAIRDARSRPAYTVASGPYRVDALDVVDMFPQTYHVESVVTLTRVDGRLRRGAGPPRTR